MAAYTSGFGSDLYAKRQNSPDECSRGPLCSSFDRDNVSDGAGSIVLILMICFLPNASGAFQLETQTWQTNVLKWLERQVEPSPRANRLFVNVDQ